MMLNYCHLGSLEINVSENCNKAIVSQEIHFKLSSAKCQPFVLIYICSLNAPEATLTESMPMITSTIET